MARLCCATLLLLVAATAAHTNLENCGSNPSACRVTGAAGSLDSSAVTATAQGGPIGAAQDPFTVDGTLTFRLGTGPTSTNMFEFGVNTSPGDAVYAQTAPPGDWGNSGSPTGVNIGDGVEFASQFSTPATLPPSPARSGPVGESKAGGAVIPTPAVDGVAAPALVLSLQVRVDLTPTGQIIISTGKSSFIEPQPGLIGTLQLVSPLFEGATDIIQSIQVPTRLQDVLADSSQLKGVRQEGQAAAAPSDDNAQGTVTAQAAQPAQTGVSGDVSPEGTVTFTLLPSAFVAVPQVQVTSFDVTLADPNPCAAGGASGICCAGGNPKSGGVCRSAPKGSCQLDSVCDGVNADCPASPNKLQGTPCPWSPSRSYLMGEAVEGQDTTVMAVSAHDAAAWLTGKPAYDTEWPECKGVCIQGACALRWNHPACCHVRRHETDGYGEDRGRPYESKGEEDMSVSSFGYWRSKNWYCWK